VTIQEKTIPVNGLPVSYLEAGETNGRVLLLLHGEIGNASLHWREIIPELAESYHVLAPNLPGYDGSAPLPDISVSALVEWLRAFLDTLGLEQAVVVGGSVSALPARLLAAAYPQYTPAIILVNGGAVPNTPPLLPVLARIPGVSQLLFYLFGRSTVSRSSLESMFFNKAVLTDEFVQQAHASAPAFARLMHGLLISPVPKERTPRVPTLLLWGSDDTMAPLDDAEALKKEIPGAKLSAVADCGHLPQIETTDVFVYQINYFLERLSRPPRSDLPGAGILTPK
jgi:pimeloyl-ACP methyl ester carboxylesterase